MGTVVEPITICAVYIGNKYDNILTKGEKYKVYNTIGKYYKIHNSPYGSFDMSQFVTPLELRELKIKQLHKKSKPSLLNRIKNTWDIKKGMRSFVSLIRTIY